MEFKKLEIKPEGNWFQRQLANPHTKKTIIYTLGGAVLGSVLFLFTELQETEVFLLKDMLGHTFTGALMGFLITNSPCARGQC